MDDENLIIKRYIDIILKYKKIFFKNIVFTAIIIGAISLLMPKTFKSTSILMPPKSQSDTGILSNVDGISFGDMFGMPKDDITNSIFAILKSRTMMESLVSNLDLLNILKFDNMEDAVEKIRKSLNYELLEEGTISVSAISKTPWFSNESHKEEARNLAQSIVIFIVKELDRVNKSLQTEQAKFQRIFMETRYNNAAQALYNAEESLKLFQEKNNTLNLTEQTKAAIKVGAEIRSQILVDEVKLGVLENELNANHPEIIKIKQEIKELEQQYLALDVRLENKSSKKLDLFPHFSEVPRLEIELMRLQRDVEIQTTLYAFLTQQYEESKIKEARDTPTIQTLDNANYPIKRYKPQRTIMVIGFTLIAFVFTFIYILLKESRIRLVS